ncbi:MAG: methionyl-tRNA formyltransferase [Gammaproteobacteria bacterium]|nr:methionyl-tRNA formyltransferase [Gammaproteobacteria bacterium]NNF60350.1 methionyl-tRNA formyltransferase [Gammaproteobacteria bacterium]NNM20606.1 methionyl-tRNA formyltransferase [Gammaproteobacteria bacterium]
MSAATTTDNKTLRVVFAGTPDFAVPSLRALADAGSPACEIIAVYTQPDRPAGRGRRVRYSDIKQLALHLGLPLQQPESLRDDQAQETLRQLDPDLMIVAAYGLILPQAVLDIPRLGCVNVHASLLPRWRGAAPVQRAMLAGDPVTGVTLMQMDAGLDTGAMLAKSETLIGADETGGELTDRLATLGAELLLARLADIAAGALTAVPQDDSQATYAPKLKKSEARIDWQQAAAQIASQVRAFNPWPVAETRWRGRQLRLWTAQALDEAASGVPGTVSVTGPALKVATGAGTLQVTELQPAGKRVMPAAAFLNAHEMAGAVLGDGCDA